MRQVILGNALEELPKLPEGSVHTCVTSPPYWGLRDYGHEGQLGLEPTPEAYVENMVRVFREVRRVLRTDGTLWLNVGDAFFYAKPDPAGVAPSIVPIPGLKPKDLIGIPWMLAMALRKDGWHLRSEIIWHKPSNVMPETALDRPSRNHETIFLLTKSPRYFYDADAIREFVSDDPETLTGSNRRTVWSIQPKPFKDAHFATFPEELPEVCIKAGTSAHGCCAACGAPWVRIVERGASTYSQIQDKPHWTDVSAMLNGRGLRTQRGGTVHSNGTFASIAVVERKHKGWRPTCSCVADTTPCVVLDPFSGSGTTLATAVGLRRDYLGVELNPRYVDLINERLDSGRRGSPTAFADACDIMDLAMSMDED